MRYAVVCEPGSSERPNEDAVFFHETENAFIGAVIDGATERLPSAALSPLLEQDNGRLTSAAFAAHVIRDAFPQVLGQPPREMLIAVNDALRAKIEPFYGELTPEAVFDSEPALTDYRHDMRLMRMVLPVCVATVVKLDWRTSQLSYANLGDTSLLLFQADGEVRRVAGDDGRISSRSVIGKARQIQEQRGVAKFREMLKDPGVVGRNLEGALYHNYVDEQGVPDPSRGLGVINGLPEASTFVQSGTLSIQNIDGVLLITDGMMWPAEKADESSEEVQQRFRYMRQVIEANGLVAYYEALKETLQQDSDLNRFPRFKMNDDATGIAIFTVN